MNYTIYIRKDNWEHFQHEPEKSELVNGLLNEYYASTSSSSNTNNKHYDTIPRKKPALSAPAVPPGKEPNKKADPLKDLLKTVDTCPHGFAKGFCKKDDCNKKYPGKKSGVDDEPR